jgi:hypothetical protein
MGYPLEVYALDGREARWAYPKSGVGWQTSLSSCERIAGV